MIDELNELRWEIESALPQKYEVMVKKILRNFEAKLELEFEDI